MFFIRIGAVGPIYQIFKYMLKTICSAFSNYLDDCNNYVQAYGLFYANKNMAAALN